MAQYMKLKIMAPSETAPAKTKPSKRPIMAKSTAPSSGIVILLMIFGTASRKIRRCMGVSPD